MSELTRRTFLKSIGSIFAAELILDRVDGSKTTLTSSRRSRYIYDVVTRSEPLTLNTPKNSSVAAPSADSAAVGHWDPPMQWPLVAVHMSVLPTGEVLVWSRGVSHHATTDAMIWNPATNTFRTVHNSYTNLFCSGHTLLSDGRLFVAAGHNMQDRPDLGVRDANLFDANANAWIKIDNMSYERWYPTTLTLANGDVLVIGGSHDGHRGAVRTPEIWHQSGSWETLPNATFDWYDYYPWMHVTPDGRVFNSGASSQTHYIDLSNGGKVTPGPSRNFGLRDYGSSVMYDSGKVLVIGGGTDPSNTQVSTNSAEIIDLNLPTPQWRYVQPMAYPRKQANATILPDGTVLVTGGTQAAGEPGADYETEIWSLFANNLVGNLANKATRIAATMSPSGSLDVYMVGLDGNMWHSEQALDGSWEEFQLLGNTDNKATDIAAVRRSDGKADVVMVGLDGYMWHNHQNHDGTWTGFNEQINNDPLPLAQSVALAISPDDRIGIYIVSTSGYVFYSERELVGGNYPWTGFQFLGTLDNRASDIAAVRRSDGSADVVIVGIDGNMWHNHQNPDGTWTGFDGRLIGNISNRGQRIALALLPDGRLDAYMVGLDGNMWHNEQHLNGGWGEFQMVGNTTNQATDIAAVLRIDDYVDVTMVGLDGNMWHSWNSPAPVYAAELWNPVSTHWATLASMRIPRTYHSTAVLLPDGRILSAGGGQGGGPPVPDHFDAEVFSPPYLFRGARPKIISAPKVIRYSSRFFIGTPDAQSIEQVTLIRLGSTTHAYNSNQRFSRLMFERSTDGLYVTAPTSTNIAPTGHYMVFILNRDGVPSIARIIRLTSNMFLPFVVR